MQNELDLERMNLARYLEVNNIAINEDADFAAKLIIEYFENHTAPAQDATQVIRKMAEALKPFTFSNAKDLRLIWTNDPRGLEGKLGKVVGIISGPWNSHAETPHMDGSVKKTREALALAEKWLEGK